MWVKRLITAWFGIDLVVALFPPIYWAASGKAPSLFGLPSSVAYFLIVGVFICLSIVVAFAAEQKVGAL